MNSIIRTVTKNLILLTALILTSCNLQSDHSIEKEDTNYKRASRLYREEKYETALNLFLKVIDSHKKAPESHLEAGRIYLEHLNDPVAAIYHFRKYLEYRPNAEESPIVKQMIERSKREFARFLAGQPFQFTPTEDRETMTMIETLKNENLLLKKELVRIKKITTLSATPQPITPKSINAPTLSTSHTSNENLVVQKTQSYIVVAGDTLSSISKKFYGTTENWEVIYQLNKEKLSSPKQLKIGQTLKLPAY